jgi:hypothetical protein
MNFYSLLCACVVSSTTYVLVYECLQTLQRIPTHGINPMPPVFQSGQELNLSGLEWRRCERGESPRPGLDGGYGGKQFLRWVMDTHGGMMEVVMRAGTSKGLVPLPRSGVVERSWGWFHCCRR